MQVWLGTMDGGGKMIAQGIVGQNRADVGRALGNPFYANSGFSASVPGSARFRAAIRPWVCICTRLARVGGTRP